VDQEEREELVDRLVRQHEQTVISEADAKRNFGFPKPPVDIYDEGLKEQERRIVNATYGFKEPAGDIHEEEQVVAAPAPIPDPEVANRLRPVLVEAMTESEPGSDNFELAAYIHDRLEEFLRDRELKLDGD
jgi:hypothetical protein